MFDVKRMIRIFIDNICELTNQNHDKRINQLSKKYELSDVKLCIESREQFEEYIKRYRHSIIDYQQKCKRIIYNMPQLTRRVKGYCEVCNRFVHFYVEEKVFASKKESFRETLVCPRCGLSNRMRMTYSIISKYATMDNMYITEQVTPFFKELKKKYPRLIGSEFISGECEPGSINNKIRHEDICNLSFDSNSLEMVISLDVLEHVYDYHDAIDEVYRVLKDKGIFIFSVPFLYKQNEEQIRVIRENGKDIYICKPEYHGNPLSKDGSLVYRIPGWSLLDYIKNIGFKECRIEMIYSTKKAYYSSDSGVPQICFVCVK